MQVLGGAMTTIAGTSDITNEVNTLSALPQVWANMHRSVSGHHVTPALVADENNREFLRKAGCVESNLRYRASRQFPRMIRRFIDWKNFLFLTIVAPVFGLFFQYIFPFPLEGAAVYVSVAIAAICEFFIVYLLFKETGRFFPIVDKETIEIVPSPDPRLTIREIFDPMKSLITDVDKYNQELSQLQSADEAFRETNDTELYVAMVRRFAERGQALQRQLDEYVVLVSRLERLRARLDQLEGTERVLDTDIEIPANTQDVSHILCTRNLREHLETECMELGLPVELLSIPANKALV